MYFQSLRDLIFHNKNRIVRSIIHRLGQLPPSNYKEFIIQTDEGIRRINIWIELVIKALEGKCETFFEDQKHMGYSRAIQGFKLNNVAESYHSFWLALREILHEETANKKLDLVTLLEDIQELNEILFQGWSTVAASFLKTREEQIIEKTNHLQELHNFTKEIIAVFELEEIVKIILKKLMILFRAEKNYVVIFQNNRMRGVYSDPPAQDFEQILPIIDKSWKEKTVLFTDEEGDVYRDVDLFQLKRVVSVPIYAHERCYGTFALVNNTKGLKFTRKELSLLQQFLYIMAIALENVFMLEEIKLGHEELRLLAGKMITFQEEERRHLASDIHDTIAQTLTGISYKLQSTREIAKRKPEVLVEKLNDSIKSVHQAIDQSRELISSLRPDLIDTAGIIPALKRFFDNYTKETGITVSAQLPEEIELPSDVKICLFRIIQEGLTNVYKHAETENAKVILKENNNTIILLLSDNGKGFEMSQGSPWVKDQDKLGFISMKERVESISGAFSIHSEVNRGCRIEVKIPFTVGSNCDE